MRNIFTCVLSTAETRIDYGHEVIKHSSRVSPFSSKLSSFSMSKKRPVRMAAPLRLQVCPELPPERRG